jgi:hypothetical protein
MIPENVQERTARNLRFRGVSLTTPINAAKEAVTVFELADKLCGPGGLRRVGSEWSGRCPTPDHEDKTPSFSINPSKNLWWCHGCLRGGDVVRLAQLAWGYAVRDSHVAAANLLHEFGHALPERPPSWFRKQGRQQPIRDALERVRVRSTQRRLMRMLAPFLARVEDDAERRDEALAVWDELGDVARMMVRRAG